MKYQNIREEELKNKVGIDWFASFDATEILGNIDFTVFPKQDNLFGRVPLLWAEAKTGNFDIPSMFVQLILTIGKARTFDKTLPPAFLGAFDFKKITFVEYINVQDIFYLNDFNWNVTPSNHEAKEFLLIKERIESILKTNTYIFDYEKDEKELHTFIKNNIANATNTSKIKIDKNNFIPIYLRWLEAIKPIIDVNWNLLKKVNILDSDFYLADLFVDDNDTQDINDDKSIRDNLFVVFQNQGYKIAKENVNQIMDYSISLRNKEIYINFWKIYKRPPINVYHDYFIERRDLLVPQDIRERKGAFFTPRIWVELSQKYLTDYLGENWQEEFYIWDCAAGTGNLLAGLYNKYNIYASTLDQADVNVMHERIEHGTNLLKNHVFQFDFLNDEFLPISKGGKMPDSLFNIINNPEKRKKLVVYINPPYAEASNAKTNRGTGENRTGVSNATKVYHKYQIIIGTAARELFAQFLTRLYSEITNCKIANFSTLKNLQSSNFKDFRNHFRAKLEKIFLAPAVTFDNVKGKFPIGFYIYNTEKIEEFDTIKADIFDSKAEFIGTKNIYSYKNDKYIIEWLRNYYDKKGDKISYLRMIGTDMQNNRGVFVTNGLTDNDFRKKLFTIITKNNVIEMCIYNTVRHIFRETWLNDRDQFLYPNNKWEKDKEFQNDCLAYTLFHSQNKISCKEGINHWIPFTEQEVNAQNRFESSFMTDFIKGKIKKEEESATIFTIISEPIEHYQVPLRFSDEAKSVFDAGRELWKYYHSQPKVNVNASLYDIKEYFQGRNDHGRMNSKSDDLKYTELIGELRNVINILADKIKPKVFEYEFLKE
jgi:hypothetical protein